MPKRKISISDPLISWIIENVEQREGSEVELIQIVNCLNDENFTSHHVGRAVMRVFPEVQSKYVRSKHVKKTHTQLYRGIALKQHTHSANSIQFVDLMTMVDTDGFFKIKQSNSQVQLGYFNGLVVNGTKLMSELTLYSSGVYEISIRGKSINLIKLGIKSIYDTTILGISTVLDIVKKLPLCNGLNQDDVSLKSLSEKDVVRELLTKSGEENSSTMKIRSIKCEQVMNFLSNYEACTACRKLISAGIEHIATNASNGQVQSKSDKHMCTSDIDEKVNSNSSDEKLIKLTETDNKDMRILLDRVLSDYSLETQVFLRSQMLNIKMTPHERRWDPQIIRLCLTLYCRSPRGYNDLAKSGYLVLPSQRMLQRYKNKVEQKPGINKNMLEWMAKEAELRKIGIGGYEGGLLFDEMAIQEDLQICRKGDAFELVGFVDCTEESDSMNVLISKKKEVKLANHVLQLVFLGTNGFRFPIAHFPTTQASASELYLIYMQAVKMLAIYGFTVLYVSLDGAQVNRDFMKMLVLKNKSEKMTSMLVKNCFDPTKPKISIIMDYSHVMKKIRNNISKSGTGSKSFKRQLLFNGKFIMWEHWIKAFQWDISVNPFPIYHRLTNEHFYLTSENKMRNALAEDVLNKEMLHLMQMYKKSLGVNGGELDSSIEFLQQTSILTDIFRDMRPIKDADDPRLIQCEHVLQWFLEWEKYNNEKCDGPKARIERSLISYQTREDIFSLLKGFQEFVKERFRTCKTSVSIIPGRINSDVIENVFCQMRGMKNGANTNPNYLGYCRSVNAIILGQTTVSRKSNTGGEGAHHVSSSSIVVPAKIPKVCQDRILQPVSLRGNLQN